MTDHAVAPLLRAVARAVPDRAAVVWRDRVVSWADLDSRAARLAAALGPGRVADEVATGWECPNRRVALYLTNCPEYIEAMLGAFAGRWAPVNVNYRYVADELVHLLDDATAEAVVFHARFAPTLATVLPRLARAPRLLLQVDDGSGEPLIEGAVPYEEALARADASAGAADPSADDRYVLYTGGTTGAPKGVLWRQGDFLATCLGVTDPLDVLVERAAASTLRVLPAAPFMHGAAHWNALSALVSGGTVVIQAHPEHLDPADLLDTCARHEVSSLLVVGDAFARPLIDELRARPRPLPDLRFLLTGGAILSPALKDELLGLLPHLRIVDILGSSESGRQGVQVSTAGTGAATGTFTAGATSVVLADDRSRRLRPGDGEIGWLAQHGRVPLGYLGDPDRTAATFPVIDGVRHAVAGDRARLLADGAIELLGRDSVTINTGGEKVFAEEVEQAVKAHPDVLDAVVVGMPSPRWGQEVAAVVSLRPGSTADLGDLQAVCAPVLARYKLPRHLVVVPAVHRSPSGKPDYAWARDQLDRGAR